MKVQIRNLKFRNQILLIFMIVFILIAAGSGLAFYHLAAASSIETFSLSAESSLAQMEDTLNTRLQFIAQRAETMLINSNFHLALENYVANKDLASRIRAQDAISMYLKDFEQGEPLISSSYLYTSNGAIDTYIHFRRMEFDFLSSLFPAVYQVRQEPAVQYLAPMRDIIFQGERQVLPCIRRFTLQNSSKWQYFIYQLDIENLKALVMGKGHFFDEVLILDDQGRVLLGELPLKEETAAFLSRGEEQDIIWNGKEYLVKYTELSKNRWRVYGLKSKAELLANLKNLRANILMTLLFLFALILPVLYWLVYRLTDALSSLQSKMNEVEKGDLSVRFYYPYENEVGNLVRSFNYMLDEIQRMVGKQQIMIDFLHREKERITQIQSQKRKSELQALQAQINPHFLYNTLNTITWQLADKGDTEGSRIASELGKFFRLSLSRGAERISLADELEHVRSYLRIQSIRYQDKLNYRIEAASELLNGMVLKLILQPLVENSIYHGIKEKEGKGEIVVTASAFRRGSRKMLCLQVTDNGIGIEANRLADINHRLRCGERGAQKGYGIYNVNERIRLYYGDLFGLSYESPAEGGLKAMIIIPWHLPEETENV